MSGLRARFQPITEFFFAPTDGSAVALFRWLYGALATWTALGVLLNLERYYGPRGLVPWSVVRGFPEQRYSLLALAPESKLWLAVIAGAFLVGAVMMMVGAWPRIGALVVYATNVALQHRNPYVLNNGDRLFVILAALALFMPLGARYSVDAWRREKRGASAPQARVFGQRLVMLQIAYIYLAACFAKLEHAEWREGVAVQYVLASPVLSEWPVWLEFLPLVQLLTWSTLAFEFLFPLLVFRERFRRYLLAWGVLFHAGIEVTLRIPMFSAVMITTYACFLSDREASLFLSWVKRILSRIFFRKRALLALSRG